MKRRANLSMGRRQNSRSNIEREVRITWGLLSRLPRWRTFDGRRSRIAPAWAAITEREIVETLTALTLA